MAQPAYRRGPYRKGGKMDTPENVDNREDVLRHSTAKELQAELVARGYFTSKVPPTASGKTFKPDIKKMAGRKYRFGVISCTQLCSKYQQLTHLYTFYKICKQRKIDTIFHCGDIVDGGHVYRGQEYELFIHAADEQVRYVVDNYPKMKGIQTKMLLGNHDESFWKIAGVNVVKDMCEKRDDFEYLGDYLTFAELDGIRIGLMHGAGGQAYARSYKLQKIIEQMAPEQKPHMLFVGHWHTTAILPMYRNVAAYSVGCFQAQTPFLTRLGLYPEVGGYIVEIVVGDNGLKSIKSEWIPFYIPIKNDF